jgi:MerR family mercuric resistance operon transcriptional regulator/MerR family gold-responsive transcriptional activator of gol and ges genes
MTVGCTTGQLAKAVGVNIQTVQYYERLRLLAPSARRPSGYRIYSEDEEWRLWFIRNAQALGFTLHEIEELLDLRVGSKDRCSAVQRKAEAKPGTWRSKCRIYKRSPGRCGTDSGLPG